MYHKTVMILQSKHHANLVKTIV